MELFCWQRGTCLIQVVSFYSYYGREQIYRVFEKNQSKANRARIASCIRKEILHGPHYQAQSAESSRIENGRMPGASSYFER